MEDISREESDKRLLMIADATDNISPERFNFKTYVGADWQGDPNLSCGTSCCSIGLATTLPYFQALGLHLVSMNGIIYPVIGEEAKGGLSYAQRGYKMAKFLGISFTEYGELFIPDGNDASEAYQNGRLPDTATPEQVAEHIRQFVSDRKDRK